MSRRNMADNLETSTSVGRLVSEQEAVLLGTGGLNIENIVELRRVPTFMAELAQLVSELGEYDGVTESPRPNQ